MKTTNDVIHVINSNILHGKKIVNREKKTIIHCGLSVFVVVVGFFTV